MCFTCTLEAVTGLDSKEKGGWSPEEVAEIVWPDCSSEMITLGRLRWALYECTSATTGGPMHIFTDDFNVEDSNLEFCLESAKKKGEWYSDFDDWPLVSAISIRMCELAAPMSEGERAVALSLSWGDLRLDHDGKVTSEMVPLWQRRRQRQLAL